MNADEKKTKSFQEQTAAKETGVENHRKGDWEMYHGRYHYICVINADTMH